MEKEFIKNISPEEGLQLIKKNEDNENFIILDVRTPDEFQDSRIGDAVNCDIFDYDFKEKLEKLDKEKVYMVYCRVGNRSQAAVSVMKNTGFKKIYHLKDGILEWEKSIGSPGLPML
ncbi:MAG: rhodanese-like domain-containing protein [Candidatus Pacebacteria bacterium]|nr:rhodanese-like domain-containing protein [Candidatus Paceibacterota bacterium]